MRIDDGLLQKQIQAKGEKKKDFNFLIGVTILHEDTHRGDDQNGVDFPGEEGSQMEQASFGVIVGEGNMNAARKDFPSRTRQARKAVRSQKRQSRIENLNSMRSYIKNLINYPKYMTKI